MLVKLLTSSAFLETNVNENIRSFCLSGVEFGRHDCGVRLKAREVGRCDSDVDISAPETLNYILHYFRPALSASIGLENLLKVLSP